MEYGATLAVVAVLLLACVALAGDHPLLVTPAWLAERLGRADVRIVDLSDAEDYAKGHIPGGRAPGTRDTSASYGCRETDFYGMKRAKLRPLRRPSKRRLTPTRDS